MNWTNLLSWKRLRDHRLRVLEPERPPWQIDYDRLIFSSAFRRLQDKTQVFPLSGSDYVRTRLTHSLEVSTLARTLGTRVGKTILDRHPETKALDGSPLANSLTPADFGMITSAAALAHDIGNPPFGHSGEDSIRHWFKSSPIAGKAATSLTSVQRRDFESWEGNAEAFRIIGRLQLYREDGGMRLTSATLGAFAKYPTAASAVATKEERDDEKKKRSGNTASLKKPGFFDHDALLWAEVVQELQLKPLGEGRWARHPLAFLTEAADDICYRIIDLEDGARMGRISFSDLEELLIAMIKPDDLKGLNRIPQWEKLRRASFLRAKAISQAVEEVTSIFLDSEAKLLEGSFLGSLTDAAPINEHFKRIESITIDKIYSTRSVLEIEAAGFEILPGLLDAFVGAVESLRDEQCPDRMKALKLSKLIPREFYEEEGVYWRDPYVRLLSIVDFVAGMTDSYALTLYRRLKGFSLPG